MSHCARACSFWRPLLLLAVVTSHGFAQAIPARVTGTIRDTNGTAVPLARLSLNGVGGLSDSAGHFLLGGLPAGTGTLSVRRIGFQPLDIALDLAAGRTDSLRVVLAILPQELAGVTTESDTYARVRLADFYRHRQNGMGYYLDRKEIEAKKVQRTTDLLRRIPGVRLAPDRWGRLQLRMTRSAGLRECPPDFWIDGVRAPFLNADDVPLNDVEALEVYRGPASLPPEFITRFGNPGCGAVVIWTRVPG